MLPVLKLVRLLLRFKYHLPNTAANAHCYQSRWPWRYTFRHSVGTNTNISGTFMPTESPGKVPPVPSTLIAVALPAVFASDTEPEVVDRTNIQYRKHCVNLTKPARVAVTATIPCFCHQSKDCWCGSIDKIHQYQQTKDAAAVKVASSIVDNTRTRTVSH